MRAGFHALIAVLAFVPVLPVFGEDAPRAEPQPIEDISLEDLLAGYVVVTGSKRAESSATSLATVSW
jgi:hypothetical protein